MLQDDVAGDFEDEIAEEEHSGAESVDALAEVEVGEHLQLGEANVDAVDVGDDVAAKEDGKDAEGDFAIEGVCGGGGRVWRVGGCRGQEELPADGVYSADLDCDERKAW